jgi:hypothetical protein
LLTAGLFLGGSLFLEDDEEEDETHTAAAIADDAGCWKCGC